MPEQPPSAGRPSPVQDRPLDRSTRSDPGENLRAQLLRIALICAATLALLAVAVVGYLLVSSRGLSSATTVVVLVVAVVVGLAVLVVAAVTAVRAVQERIAALRTATREHHQEIQRLVERLRRGERSNPAAPEPPGLDSDEFQLLAHDIDRLRHVAMLAMAETPMLAPAPAPDHRVGVFVNLARRLQSLVHREIQLLDELEAQVEDPDLLKGLFSVDHLATRIRRHAENLAVLGGAVSRRQWSRPVNLYEVLRSAVAEVERYSRVKLVRPIEGTLQGHAVADVIHLVAELVENATNFSNPDTQVLLRAQRVTAGLAVEVEDRGLGMQPEEQRRVNNMLAAPDQIDIDELLRDGRIGLFVVSALARRHGIAVQLQTNIYGGTQAVLVLPTGLLGAQSTEPQLPPSAPAQRAAAQVSAPTSPPVTALPARPAPSPSLYPTNRAATGPEPASQPVVAARQTADPAAGDGWRPSTGNGHSSPLAEPHTQRATPPEGKPARPTSLWDTAVNETVPASDPPNNDPRPPLPHRRRQSHLSPQLRDAPTETGDAVEGPDPGLMSAFQRGFQRAEKHPDDPGTS